MRLEYRVWGGIDIITQTYTDTYRHIQGLSLLLSARLLTIVMGMAEWLNAAPFCALSCDSELQFWAANLGLLVSGVKNDSSPSSDKNTKPFRHSPQVLQLTIPLHLAVSNDLHTIMSCQSTCDRCVGGLQHVQDMLNLHNNTLKDKLKLRNCLDLKLLGLSWTCLSKTVSKYLENKTSPN